MKRLFIFILFFSFASHVFSQEEENIFVIDWKVIDSIVISPVLEFKDPIVERIFDSIVQEDKINNYLNDSNFFGVVIRENKNINILEMYIDVSDYLNEWVSSMLHYGCIYYCNKLFVIHGYDASLFFRRTDKFEKLNIKYVYTDFVEINDPIKWWTFRYDKNNWYDFEYDIERHQWRYYNYNNNEVKWLDSE
ncbi:MAG: hypothetical protein IKJ56_05310 [Bacteroidales bacterium]|nr:hypothetical protein [Bacteroidales bacterium]